MTTTTASLAPQDRLDVPSDALPDGTVDVVVIGCGAAGLNGALMLGRSRRSVVVVDGGAPRNAPADGVHGLLGREGMPPAELLALGRAEVRGYGGRIVTGQVAAASPVAPVDGDLRFTVTLADGRTITSRRLLVATGVRDVLPDVVGLAAHWGHGIVHCPYCHGWEVRDQPIGVLATGPASVHQALLFRQLTEDLVVFAAGVTLDEQTRARFAARDIRVVDESVVEVLTGEDGALTGVRLADGQVVARRAVAVATTMQPRLDGLDGLGLPVEDLPMGYGRRVVSGMAGVTGVPGVWVAGNVTDPTAQVGAAAAAGAMAGANLNADLVTADTDAAVARTAAA
ncbi:NAD(P)/FAD-dependent oxidoreductase [Tersicoccus sp. MR15.9]|uniref:NAD(P)/FAD-dependent oxidoreductase n=1 Tax=Tersicoccus mangrovi TaxID=3121635 RepID=UPI002FE5E1CE